MNAKTGPVDVLAVGAHPDDVELGVGGMLHKLAASGYRVGILDLSRGELSTRGSVAERGREALDAAKLLGVQSRENANLPDGGIVNSKEYQLRIIPYIRTFRPRILLTLTARDRHPDHSGAHGLVRDAAFFAGLAQIETPQEPYRPSIIYHYAPYYEEEHLPSLVVDISEHMDAKLAALKAHASQFVNPNYAGKPTFVSTQSFWDFIETRAAYWGHRIHAKYGEPLFADGPLGVALPPGLEGCQCGSA